ncbi:MAG: peptidoglycan DD-metalloendopeptidase family protein, partial [Chthoniobacterales bacterium]
MTRAQPYLALAALLICLGTATAAQEGASVGERFQYAPTRSADGFDMPVGKPDAEGYYRSRGLIVGRHMGDDWNGSGGGNTDLGAPVYNTAHGLVVYARDARMGWGKLVIVRHAYWQGAKWNYVDSLYAHLHQIFVREGQQLKRGQLLGTIGTNRGMYTARELAFADDEIVRLVVVAQVFAVGALVDADAKILADFEVQVGGIHSSIGADQYFPSPSARR